MENLFDIETKQTPFGTTSQEITPFQVSEVTETTPHLIGVVNSHLELNPQKIEISPLSIDWVQGSFPYCHLYTVIHDLEEFYNEKSEPSIGIRGYDSAFSIGGYCTISYDSTVDKAQKIHGGKFVVQITGQGIHDEPINRQLELLKIFKSYDFNCTRIDTCYDDFNKIIDPDSVFEALEKGNVKRNPNYSRTTSGKAGKKTGSTTYIGSRGKSGGGKFLRIYDKNQESNGQIDSIRWEVEFSKSCEKSQQVYQNLVLCNSPEEFVSTIGSIIADSVDFINREDFGQQNVNRIPRLTWWVNLLSAINKDGKEIKIRSIKKDSTVLGFMNYLKVAVAPTLSCLNIVFSDVEMINFYEYLSEEGQKKHKRKHEKFILELKDIFDRLQEVAS